ncbi:MAG: hypothetical protein FJ260_11025 [Planctomycetes bacterium]|nr:hypothetical protein [Planctomycetota bacterium]
MGRSGRGSGCPEEPIHGLRTAMGNDKRACGERNQHDGDERNRVAGERKCAAGGAQARGL